MFLLQIYPMKIFFVINPRSGVSKQHKQIEEQLVSICRAKGAESFAYTLPQEKNEKDLIKSFEDFKPDLVLACGGDGTVNFVASLLLNTDILFSIVPMGSANGLATAMDIRLEPERIIENCLKGNFINMDVLKINGSKNCFHLSSLGLNAQLVKKYDEANSKGLWGYAKHFFSTFIQKSSKNYILHLNGSTISRKADMITFANAKKYGTGAVINPDGKVDDGKFEVCIFRPISWQGLIRLAYHFFLGNLKNSPFVKIVKTSKVKLMVSSKESLEIDGDVEGEFSEVEVEIQKGALKIIPGKI